jgi:hypothetical protein
MEVQHRAANHLPPPEPIMTKQITIKECKQGEYVQLTDGGPVWIRGTYDRETKKYCLTSFDDIGREILRRGAVKVFVGFTF